MDLSFLTMFLDSSKVAGYARAAAAGGLTILLTKYPVLSPFIDPAAQAAVATIASTIAVGVWSHIAKTVAPPVATPAKT